MRQWGIFPGNLDPGVWGPCDGPSHAASACRVASGPTFFYIDCLSDSVGICPPSSVDRRNGHSLALRRTVAAGPPPWASKNGHWPPHPSPQWGAPAPAGGASAPTLKLGAPPPNPHLNMVVVG